MRYIPLIAALSTFSTTALAGVPAPVPGPVLGVAGPWGLAVAAVGYGAYKLYRYRKDQ